MRCSGGMRTIAGGRRSGGAASVRGIKPRRAVLETAALPLSYTDKSSGPARALSRLNAEAEPNVVSRDKSSAGRRCHRARFRSTALISKEIGPSIIPKDGRRWKSPGAAKASRSTRPSSSTLPPAAARAQPAALALGPQGLNTQSRSSRNLRATPPAHR